MSRARRPTKNSAPAPRSRAPAANVPQPITVSAGQAVVPLSQGVQVSGVQKVSDAVNTTVAAPATPVDPAATAAVQAAQTASITAGLGAATGRK